MNRCYSNADNKCSSQKSQLQISSCLRSPGVLLRQKSFHTLNELSKFCQLKSSQPRYSVDDNILPHSLTNGNISCRIDQETTIHNDLTDNSPVILRKSSATCNNAYNNNNNNSSNNNNKNKNKNSNNNNNSSNRNINNNNSNNNNNNYHHAQTENLATAVTEAETTSQYVAKSSRRDNSVALHCNAPLNNAFRWSEQLTQNVSVAKIRTAISCTSQDLKEMEFLLPHAHAPVTTTPASLPPLTVTTTTTGIGGSDGLQHHDKSSSVLGLSIARHIRKSSEQSSQHQHQHQQQHQNSKSPQLKHATKMHAAARRHELSLSSGPGIGIGVGGSGKMLLASPQSQRLAIHRHPANARATVAGVAVGTVAILGGGSGGVGGIKGAGNTPYYSKMSKKQLKLAQAQLDKLTQINLHLHALFSAVEHGHMDKARTILESTDVDVNSINSDGLSALDVAVLSNNRSMTKMLLQHGAVEGSQFSTETIGAKLNALLKDAESRIYDLSGAEGSCQPTFTSRPSISSIIIGNTGSSVTGCTGNEIDKQIGIWERRVKGLRRMLLGWDQARPPDAPVSVTVDVTGESAMTVQILEPFESAICTKFKVQWSTRADFNNIVGERELMDFKSFHGTMGTQCYVSGLTPGRRYFVRAACGNVKGWGPFKTSVPASVVPSSWRDLNNREDRYVGQQRVLDNLFTAVRLARPADASELTLDPPATHRRNPKKKTTIKQLFSVASKFQKNLRRGIYLASIIYCEDKVLVTSEDFLPVIEIDETYPGTLHSDYHWLMKVACTWDDVKSLRSDMERNLTSAAHFRTKLLSAICQMQSALGLTDLGTLYYKPLRDSHGTVVLTCIQTVRSQKTVSILNSRWLPVNKLQKKIVALLEDYNINEMLISSVSDQIHYHQTASQRLEHGLYLGYLKMQCSVEQIQLVVPMKTPNVLPHCKVRDNSHITAEEWQVLKRGEPTTAARNALGLSLEFNSHADGITEVQRLFLYDLTTAAHKLLAYMNIKPDEALTHRLYDIEVIEHSHDISFLVICPSVELTCAVPGQSELLLQRDDLASLSIQAFEMIHLRTYQPGIIQKYARLSCILELDTAAANHSHREAFSTSELQTAKERLVKLHELSASLNAVWKSVRWLMDVIAFARDKTAQSSVAMKEILEFAHADENSQQQQLLQLPIRDVKFTKSGSGRGSWPGPGANTQSGCGSDTYSTVEHSKSEQNLGLSARTPTAPLETTITFAATTTTSTTTTTATGGNSSSSNSNTQQLLLANSDMMPRKNSGDSMSSQYTSRSFYSTAGSAAGSNNELGILTCIPPSRSDDTLSLAAAEALKHKQTGSLQRKRTSSNIISGSAANCSPPLITVYSSSSAPYLVGDVAVCSLGGKSDTKVSKVATTTSNESDTVKPKSVSSINLRDGGLYLKSTLSALQTEIKDASGNVIELPAAATATTNSEEDVVTVSSAQTSNAATVASGAATANQSSGIIHVYTAYNTGLASGTSLKLHVTPKTTAREVINLVVKQLNMAAVLKGSNGPIYTAEMLDNFCLVAIIGARERCLRDDFKPLLLQDPWRKGRLYVRQKHELLAAIEHANRKSHLI